MNDVQRLSRGQDYVQNIARMLGDLQGTSTVVHELLQNADDAPGATRVRFTVTEAALEVWNDGVFEKCDDLSVDPSSCSWLGERNHRCDFHSFRLVGSGDKQSRPGTTGAFGIGFTAVYQLTDRPELISNGEHWIVDEMADTDDRIQRVTAAADHPGTTLRLPWATASSPFRKRLKQDPVSGDVVLRFPDELRMCVLAAMPFLKKIESIEIASPATNVRFDRVVDEHSVTIRSSDGDERRWMLLRGEFSSAAEQMKANHAEVIEPWRSPHVTVAIPIAQPGAHGVLYATLPTEETLPLSFSINADFYPASDRKRIRFDQGARTEWNRLAIRSAAVVLAARLGDLPNMIGDTATVELLRSVRDLHTQLSTTPDERMLGAFWEAIREALPTTPVVPTVSGRYGVPSRVRLWSDPAECEAWDLLSAVGIELVASEVRAAWHQIRSAEVGIENLHLRDVAAQLATKGLTTRWTTTAVVSGLDKDSVGRLWALIEVLLAVRDRSDTDSRERLARCSLAPDLDGTFWPIDKLHRVDRAARAFLTQLGATAAVLDDSELEVVAPRLADIVPTADPDVMAALLEPTAQARPWEADVASRVLRWFFEHRADLTAEQRRRIADLSMFPTARGPRPLRGLALPGEFKDPLGLASILSLDGVEEMVAFFESLGARRLTLPDYCIRFLAPAVREGELAPVQREHGVRLLARQLNEIREHPAVREALRPLALVPCRDGQVRPASTVYLRDDLSLLVGDSVAVAVLPELDRQAHHDLYRWLGAADRPRPRDIELRCKALAAGGPDHRRAAEAIIQYVGQRFSTDRDRAQADFAPLRQINWLPVEGDQTRGHRPEIVWLRFRKSLFASQASFLDVGQSIEQGNADFLRWLGLRQEPTPAMVVAHLLERARRNEPVGEDVWLFLDQNADDAALDQLVNAPCLPLQETKSYVTPNEVYWGSHEFGRWRHTLGESFAKHRRFLERLHVAEHPSPDDAIEVLLDIAVRHGGEATALIPDDALVVQSCWRMLADAVVDELIPADALHQLSTAEVVLDSTGQPRRPIDVYFRDSVVLAERFGPDVRHRLIDRPEGAWQALAAAGVRNLSDAVRTSILERTLLGEGGALPERLRDRARALTRVLSHEAPDATAELRSLVAGERLQRVGVLVIQQALELDEIAHSSEPFERDALFLRDSDLLIWVDRHDREPSWVEVARELARAVGVDASSTAAAFRGVLSAGSAQAADRELDELGFPALDRRTEGIATPAVTQGLAGVDADRIDVEELAPHAADEFPSACEDPSFEEAADAPTAAARQSAPVSAADVDEGGARPSIGGGTERTPSDTDPPQRHRSSASPGQQSRLRSYVAPRTGANELVDDETTPHMDLVDRAAVAAALEYERAHGREPVSMPHDNPGYDIKSEHPDGEVRFIEVKGTDVPWGGQGVAISSRQYFEAQQRRENYWLYVVDQATIKPTVHAIQDPVSQIGQYFFDHGWQVLSERADAPRTPLPPLRLHAFEHDPNTVPLLDLATPTATTRGRVPCTDPRRRDGWFAVQVPGHSLGLANRGGLVFVEPMQQQLQEDDLIVASLHDQVDPDTGSALSIRLWRPETDLQGNTLAVRLWSTHSVAPLTVHESDKLVIHGLVVGRALSAPDLERLGLL